MPLFQISDRKLSLIKPKNFSLEKEIQNLIEQNLETVFGCRFVKSEFPTGAEHAGRIDSLGLSEDGNPVIIEYKKVESSELINQSLYYLHWINDHRGDFEVLAQKTLGKDIIVEWSDIRVICIAPGYKKYDLHAVQMMGAHIELWQYKYFDNGTLYLDEIAQRNYGLSAEDGIESKNPVMVAAGKKAALTRATGIYSFEEHLGKTSREIKQLMEDLRDYCLNLDEAVEETPKKFYIAYKMAQNFVCAEIKKDKIILFLKLDPAKIEIPPNGRDVSKIGHYGTGNFELVIKNKTDLEKGVKFIKASFDNVGG